MKGDYIYVWYYGDIHCMNSLKSIPNDRDVTFKGPIYLRWINSTSSIIGNCIPVEFFVHALVFIFQVYHSEFRYVDQCIACNARHV